MRALKESPVVLVCQHLFNCPMKEQQNIIFSEGGGTSVHRLRWGWGVTFTIVWNMRRLRGPPNSDKIGRRYWIRPEFL